MSDLISRGWLLDVIENIQWDTEKGRDRAIHQVRKLTPAVQPVDLVRCKDCKHYKRDSQGISYCYENRGYGWKRDDFCSYGERKDDEQEGRHDKQTSGNRST